jgi:hypothetical protein
MYESMMRDLQKKNYKTWEILSVLFCCNVWELVFAAMYLQCISWDVFVVLQHLLFSTTSKRTWPREIKAVFLDYQRWLPECAGTSKRTAGREWLQAGMVRGREWVTSMDPLIPGVEQIRSRIGSWENERGLMEPLSSFHLSCHVVQFINMLSARLRPCTDWIGWVIVQCFIL